MRASTAKQKGTWHQSARQARTSCYISSRSIRTPTRKEVPAALTRIRVETSRIEGTREKSTLHARVARSRYADRREKERGKCLGRGKGSSEESWGAHELFLMSTHDPSPTRSLVHLASPRPPSFICLAPSAWEADPN